MSVRQFQNDLRIIWLLLWRKPYTFSSFLTRSVYAISYFAYILLGKTHSLQNKFSKIEVDEAKIRKVIKNDIIQGLRLDQEYWQNIEREKTRQKIQLTLLLGLKLCLIIATSKSQIYLIIVWGMISVFNFFIYLINQEVNSRRKKKIHDSAMPFSVLETGKSGPSATK